ncbi:hypothetical protein JTB14_015699 [Gonioctena quinquepunctata]|nr:hypothetical protein JTB14_015699 [Gonioctena quinquepunctata]
MNQSQVFRCTSFEIENTFVSENDDSVQFNEEECETQRFGEVSFTATIDKPQMYKEAIKCDHEENWQKAMKDEMKYVIENDTEKLETLSYDHPEMSRKWVSQLN